jgi:hypothetical protein
MIWLWIRIQEKLSASIVKKKISIEDFLFKQDSSMYWKR